MLFIPNILWSRQPPEGYSSKGENCLLAVLERIGEVAVTCCALLFSDFNLQSWTPWSWLLVASFVLMLLYELWWIRYFNRPCLETFYGSLLGIPVAGATLPVAAMLLLGVYGRVIWMLLAALVLGVGHIGIHLGHLKELHK